MIIGFLRSPRWKTPVMSFIDEYCTAFDDEDEHKLEFTKTHNVSKSKAIKAKLIRIAYLYPLLLTGFQENCGRLATRTDVRIGRERCSIRRSLLES